jgi:AcrR family transcriptional regulator
VNETTNPRRTQRERRETTIAKLVQATIASLHDVGYARTSAKEVCARAGVTQGALFRHFPTVADVLVAAAEEIGRRQVGEFEERFASAGKSKAPLAKAIELLRAQCRAPLASAWAELMVAARTDAALREKLTPAMWRYGAAINQAARAVPALAAMKGDDREALLFALVYLFDGEALTRLMLQRPEIEDHRLALMTRLIENAARSR